MSTQVDDQKECLFISRMDLLECLYGKKYALRATCPNCAHVLAVREIISGFHTDPDNMTTCCPACGARFHSTLLCRNGAVEGEFLFYCGDQTVLRMGHKIMLRPQRFEEKHPEIYHSAMVHFGSLRQAFKKIGMTYRHEEAGGWQGTITPLLGRFPDEMIAECVNVDVAVVRTMREESGIPLVH